MLMHPAFQSQLSNDVCKEWHIYHIFSCAEADAHTDWYTAAITSCRCEFLPE